MMAYPRDSAFRWFGRVETFFFFFLRNLLVKLRMWGPLCISLTGVYLIGQWLLLSRVVCSKLSRFARAVVMMSPEN